jgi:hypothetical protein
MQTFSDEFQAEIRKDQPRAALLASIAALLRGLQGKGAPRPQSTALADVARHFRDPQNDLGACVTRFFDETKAQMFTDPELAELAEALVDTHTPDCILVGTLTGPQLEAHEARCAKRRYDRLQAGVEALGADAKLKAVEERLRLADIAIDQAIKDPFRTEEAAFMAAERAYSAAERTLEEARTVSKAAKAAVEERRAALQVAEVVVAQLTDKHREIEAEMVALRNEAGLREQARDGALASLHIADRKLRESNGEDRSDAKRKRGED